MKSVRILCLTLLAIPSCGSQDAGGSANPSVDAAAPMDGQAVFDRYVPPQPDAEPDQSMPDACDPESPDPADEDGIDSNCDGADGVEGLDVYVDPANGDDSNEGSAAHPVATLDRAMGMAEKLSGTILVAGGTLLPKNLELTRNVHIAGGYAKSFRGKVDRSRTVLNVPAEGWNVSGKVEVSLEHLTLRGGSVLEAAKDATAYGLVLDVTRARLNGLDVESGDGRSGAAGKLGESGAPGLNATDTSGKKGLTCSGQTQPSHTNGADRDEPNAAGQPPANLSTRTPAPKGNAGYPGVDGINASGTPAMDVRRVLSFGFASAGSSNGSPGYGGPGGTSTDGCVAAGSLGYSIAPPGGGGTGGCPGRGGSPGQSGGGSVAVLVLSGEVTLTHSRLGTGFAGSGGDGGAGGPGGGGGRGAKPTTKRYTSTSCNGSPTLVSMPDACPPDPSNLNCIGYGGWGGDGGAGGRGGAGAGGWTIGVLTFQGAKATADSSNEWALGKPGSGGLGGSARAPEGQRMPTHHIIATPTSR